MRMSRREKKTEKGGVTVADLDEKKAPKTVSGDFAFALFVLYLKKERGKKGSEAPPSAAKQEGG